MSKHAFTPGPWSFEPQDGSESIYEVMADSYFVATAHDGVKGECNAEANARLIAAAPDLLEVLLMVGEAAMDMRGEDFNLTTEQWAKYHAAIAKATGEQHE